MLYPDAAIMPDGYRLPLDIYRPRTPPRAVFLALHGFNDYRKAFVGPGRYFANHGILTVAYDQRGFGETAERGLWPDGDTLERDATTLAGLLCRQYPGVPLYLLGESMGGAVSMLASREAGAGCIRGLILVAPAVWGWSVMPFWQAGLLRIAAWLFPARTVTGESLDILPSDNLEMLRALGRDPLVIKATRLDTVYGLTGLMDRAYHAGPALTVPVLLLYGEHDEVIPRSAVCRMVSGLPDTAGSTWQTVLYPDGYHMLTRDLQAAAVLEDIVAWVGAGRSGTLPSGQGTDPGSGRFRAFCGGASGRPRAQEN
jgi:alpha-beta hydrolase superfamily lysophospholipase